MIRTKVGNADPYTYKETCCCGKTIERLIPTCMMLNIFDLTRVIKVPIAYYNLTYSVGAKVGISGLARIFVVFRTFSLRTTKALARLRICTVSPESSLLAYAISVRILSAGSFIENRYRPLKPLKTAASINKQFLLTIINPFMPSVPKMGH